MKDLKKNSLKGKRIGIPRHAKPPLLVDDGLTNAVDKIFDEAIKTLKVAGAIVVDNTNFASYDDLLNGFATIDAPVVAVISPIDFVAELRKYLSQLKTNPNNITNLRDLYDHTQTEEREQYPEKNTDQWDFLLIFLSNESKHHSGFGVFQKHHQGRQALGQCRRHHRSNEEVERRWLHTSILPARNTV